MKPASLIMGRWTQKLCITLYASAEENVYRFAERKVSSKNEAV